MKYLCAMAGCTVMLVHAVVADISDWKIDRQALFSATDSISYRYRSNHDTTINRIYLHIGKAGSGLDSGRDMLLFTIMIIDNNTTEQWEEHQGVMADGNPEVGAYLFSPGRPGLAPGRYFASITDPDTVVTDTFLITEPVQPFRFVSGMVTPPAGVASSFISVVLGMAGSAVTLGGWTGENGAYNIGIDRTTLEEGGWKGRVCIDSRFNGYCVVPTAFPLDFSTDSWEEVNFSFVPASALLRGTVQTASGSIAGAAVVLQDGERNPVARTVCTADGGYAFTCAPGVYTLQAEVQDQEINCLVSPAVLVEALHNGTTGVDITMPLADAFIYGRITIKNRAPGVVCGVGAYHATVGHTITGADNSGRFRIPVSRAATVYTVCLEECDRALPFERMIVEGGKRWKEARAGDTVSFNLIDKPEGGVRGAIVNNSGRVAGSFYVSLFDLHNDDAVYHFETARAGDYLFEGIPEGEYYGEAGMIFADDGREKKKLRKKMVDGKGVLKPLEIGKNVVAGIDWIFTLRDTARDRRERLTGDGVLALTVIDSTKAMIEKVTVHFLDRLPDGKETVLPVYSYPVENRITATRITGIPNRPLFIAVELIGNVLMKRVLYETYITGSDGKPLLMTFGKGAPQSSELAVFEHDRKDFARGSIERDGNGAIDGRVTYNGPLSSDKISVLLYNINSERLIRSVVVSKNGGYRFERVPSGNFRVVAVIDTNMDKNPETMAICDTICAVTDSEAFRGIDIAFVDKPVGRGYIAGSLSGIERLSDGMTVTIAALPADAGRHDTARLTEMAFMSAYRTTAKENGTFVIEDLPEGVYYVVAAAEVKSPRGDTGREVAFGAFGAVRFKGEGGFPFDPAPVAVGPSGGNDGILVAMVLRTDEDKLPMVSSRKLRIPPSFALQSSRLDRLDGRVELEFAIPEDAAVSFSLMNLQGKILAEMPQKQYAPGYHIVNWKVASVKTTADIDEMVIVSMKSTHYRAQNVVKFMM